MFQGGNGYVCYCCRVRAIQHRLLFPAKESEALNQLRGTNGRMNVIISSTSTVLFARGLYF
jgi:hypothetical protein